MKFKEVPFETMINCDGVIICEYWLLDNSINKYGVNLKGPMMFNEFLKQIGTYLTSMNCKALFKYAKWYVIDDGIQPDLFIKRTKGLSNEPISLKGKIIGED